MFSVEPRKLYNNIVVSVDDDDDDVEPEVDELFLNGDDEETLPRFRKYRKPERGRRIVFKAQISMKNFLIVLLGPTGVGKTDISIDIASHFNCEIISADSRQFFREMSIGTAVPSELQLETIKHHFIRFLSVKDYYSSSLFERDVLNLLPDQFSRNNIILMSGGSGMYIDAVCKGIDDIPDVDTLIRTKYIEKYKEEGN